ncbi:serine/threonine-protein kinase Rio2p [Diutina catenulata]
MKFDTSHMRYLTADDWKVLQGVEIGARSHELVPTHMIHKEGGMRAPSATNRAIGDLAKLNLVSRLRNAKYDGFRLTYAGYDYLALKSLLNRDSVYSVGNSIGVGKESDIYQVSDNHGTAKALKIHRLGRTSFKTVKNNRDYLRNNQYSSSWMFLSRLAAEKEYQFMTVLYNNGFNVPTPYDQSRHMVLMEKIDGYCMKHMKNYSDYKSLYSELMKFIVKLANHGLIHCDFNEFNLIILNNPQPDEPVFIVIDFPQCVSIDHPDAKSYFDRDVEGVRAFFEKKFRYRPEHDPTFLDTEGYGEGFRYAYPNFARDVTRIAKLDEEVRASGYKKKMTGRARDNDDLEAAFAKMRVNAPEELSEVEDDDDDEDEDDEDYDSDEYDELEQEEEEDLTEENEKIIEALKQGRELKMDKMGNYIWEE